MSRFSKSAAATKRARRLRRDSTDVERKLWPYLRAAQVAGVSFRKQHPIGPHIVDFCAPSLKLVIELDGGQHAGALDSDAKRTAWLEREEFTVIRFWNNDIIDNINGVRETILGIVANRKRPLPAFENSFAVGLEDIAGNGVVSAPPLSGEGEITGYEDA